VRRFNNVNEKAMENLERFHSEMLYPNVELRQNYLKITAEPNFKLNLMLC
jgi:hypothetical protein